MKYYEQITKEEVQSKKQQGWGINRTMKHFKDKLNIITPGVIENVVKFEYWVTQ